MEVKQVCSPMDFGVENLALPNHLNVSLITANQGIVRANSLVLSYNSSVFKNMFGDQEPCCSVHLPEYTKYVVDCFVKILYSGRVDFEKLLFLTQIWKLAERFDVKWLLERFKEHSDDQAYFEQQQTQWQLQNNSTFERRFNEHSQDQAYFERRQTQPQLKDNSTFERRFNEHSEDQAYFEQQQTQPQLKDNSTFERRFNEHSEDQAYFEHRQTQPQLKDNSTFEEQFNDHSEDQAYFEQQQTQPQLKDNSTFEEQFNDHSEDQAYFEQQQTQPQLKDNSSFEEQFNEHSEDQAYFKQVQQTQPQLKDNSTFEEQFNEHSLDQAYFEQVQQTQPQLKDNSTFEEQFNEHSEDQAYFEQQQTQPQLKDNSTFEEQFNEHSEDQAYFEQQQTQPQLKDNSTFGEQFNEHSEDQAYFEQQQTQPQLKDNSTFEEQFNEHSEDQAYFEQQQTQWPLIQKYTTSELNYGEKLELEESPEKRRRLLPQENYCHRDGIPSYRYPHKEIAFSSSSSTRSTYDKMIKYVASKQARSIYKRTVKFTEVSIIHRPNSTSSFRSNNASACDDNVIENVIGTASIPNLVFSLPNDLDTFLPRFLDLDGFLDYLICSSFSFQNMFMFIEFVFIVKKMPCTYKSVDVSELKKDLVELTQRIVDIRKRYGWKNVPEAFLLDILNLQRIQDEANRGLLKIMCKNEELTTKTEGVKIVSHRGSGSMNRSRRYGDYDTIRMEEFMSGDIKKYKFFWKHPSTHYCTKAGACGFILCVVPITKSFDIRLSTRPEDYSNDIHCHPELLDAENMHLVLRRDFSTKGKSSINSPAQMMPISWQSKPTICNNQVLWAGESIPDKAYIALVVYYSFEGSMGRLERYY